LLDELLPQVAVTIRITTTECMGPGVRRDDEGVFVDTSRKFLDSNFKQPSVLVPAPPREFKLLVYLPFLRGDGTPKGAPW
jgi:hypothetical protein